MSRKIYVKANIYIFKWWCFFSGLIDNFCLISCFLWRFNWKLPTCILLFSSDQAATEILKLSIQFLHKQIYKTFSRPNACASCHLGLCANMLPRWSECRVTVLVVITEEMVVYTEHISNCLENNLSKEFLRAILTVLLNVREEDSVCVLWLLQQSTSVCEQSRDDLISLCDSSRGFIFIIQRIQAGQRNVLQFNRGRSIYQTAEVLDFIPSFIC